MKESKDFKLDLLKAIKYITIGNLLMMLAALLFANLIHLAIFFPAFLFSGITLDKLRKKVKSYSSITVK